MYHAVLYRLYNRAVHETLTSISKTLDDTALECQPTDTFCSEIINSYQLNETFGPQAADMELQCHGIEFCVRHDTLNYVSHL